MFNGSCGHRRSRIHGHKFRSSGNSAFDAYKAETLRRLYGIDAGDDARRRYITTTVRQRLHQRAFRERVLDAYRQQCALCRLRHQELLDAAHIIPDSEEEGEPVVKNGLALCKLHHAAFDAYFLAIRPDYTVEVRPSILEEHDGPMLLHGLQHLHNTRIWHPKSAERRPDRDLLASRYVRFRRAS